MSPRRTPMLDAGNGFDAMTGRRMRQGALVAFALACLVPGDAFARGRDRDERSAVQPQANPPAAQALPTTLTKTMAIDALIGALAVNNSPKSEKTLEQVVTGEIAFGGHSKQAAQSALLLFAMRPTPAGDAFLLRIFTDPDAAVRPGDQGVYPAADLRLDAAHVLAKVGSPSLRLELAKVYTQSSTQPAVRSAIEQVIRTPATANFAAQVEVFRSAEAPDTLKDKLQKILVEKNAAAVKLALRLEGDATAQPGAAGANPFAPPAGGPNAAGNPAALLAGAAKMFGSAGGLPGMPPGGKPGAPLGGAPANGLDPAKLAQAIAALQNAQPSAGAASKTAKPGGVPPVAATPELMMLELMGQIQNLQPIDPGLVARDLWKPDFVDAIAKKLADGKVDEALVGALASLPTKSAREKLRDLLHKDRNKGPQDLGKLETADTTAAGAPADSPSPPSGTKRRMTGKRQKGDEGGFFGGDPAQAEKPRGKKMGFGFQLPGSAEATKKEVVEFGKDWYDPGSLVVLKTVVSYQERPPEKAHRQMYPQRAVRMSPGMEKRLHDRAEKQKALESTYEWRDAIEKAIRQWDERLAAVAEAPAEPATSGENASDPDEKAAPAATKTAKSGSPASAKASNSAASKKTAAAPAATPSVAMPFSLHVGGAIAKEYHLRWPQDAAASLGSAVTEPLALDYVRLQGTGEFGKSLTHYRSAIAAIPGAKARIFLRSIENGKWLDAVQKDDSGHKTRSIDVLVTREASDDDKGKKSKQEELTVEILMVEIETPGPEATPGNSKKEPRETTSTTPP